MSESVVEVYALHEKIVLTPLAWWEDLGAWTATNVVEVVGPTSTDEELGNAVIRLLKLPASPELDPKASELTLRAAGVRSHAALVRQARYVFVRLDMGDGLLTVVGSVRDERGGGWATKHPDDGVVLTRPSPSEVGSAVNREIDSST